MFYPWARIPKPRAAPVPRPGSLCPVLFPGTRSQAASPGPPTSVLLRGPHRDRDYHLQGCPRAQTAAHEAASVPGPRRSPVHGECSAPCSRVPRRMGGLGGIPTLLRANSNACSGPSTATGDEGLGRTSAASRCRGSFSAGSGGGGAEQGGAGAGPQAAGRVLKGDLHRFITLLPGQGRSGGGD